MDGDNKGRLRPNVGWHTSPQVFIQEIDDFVINCPSPCSTFEEHGLYSAKKGIQYMRSSAASANEKIRPGAQLATIFMTDEDDQSYNDGEDPDGTGPQNNPAAVLASYEQFFAANPLAFSINGPQTNGCDFSDHGYAYEQAALASGGAFASICSNDLETTISTILDIVAGRASTFTLPGTPISSTLRVYQGDPDDPTERRWVPRSREDGFDYFPQTNSIAFFGSYRPKASTRQACAADGDCAVSGEVCRASVCELQISVQVAVHYEQFRRKEKNNNDASTGGN